MAQQIKVRLTPDEGRELLRVLCDSTEYGNVKLLRIFAPHNSEIRKQKAIKDTRRGEEKIRIALKAHEKARLISEAQSGGV